jgi:hypothetical protein
MPDFVMLIQYPFSKPIDTRGAVTRIFKSEDIVHVYVFPPLHFYSREDIKKSISSVMRNPSVSPGDETRAITPPTVTRIVEETSGAEVSVT